MESIFGCVQCYACLRINRWENIMYAWWNQSTTWKLWTDFENCKTSLSARSRTSMRFVVGWSRKRNVRLELKWKRCELCFWQWHCLSIPYRPWYWFNLQSPSGSRVRIWILCKETISNSIQCSKLLRIVWKFRCNYERRWIFNVFFPNIEGY